MWQTYKGDGSKGPFTFTFGASNVNQILCIVSTGYGDMTLNGADFSVTLNKDQDNNPGGIVTLDQVLPIGHYLTVGLVGQIVQTPNSVERRKGARSDVVCRHLKSIEDQYRESVFKTEKIYTDCADKLDDFTESEKKVITDKLDKVNSDIDSMKTESEGRLSALESSVTNTENNINQQIENTKANVDNKLLVIKQAIEVNGQNIQKNKENIAANDTAIKTNLASINSLKTRVTKTEQDITANKTAVEERVTTLESTSSDHETRIKANETELADHEKRITTNAADIDKLETRATNLESTVGEHTVSIESHESRLNNIETTTDAGKWAEKLAALDAKDEELETSITNLPDKYVTLDTAQNVTGIKTFTSTVKHNINVDVADAIQSTADDYTVAPTSQITRTIRFYDKNGMITGGLEHVRYTDRRATKIRVQDKTSGNTITSDIAVSIYNDGHILATAPNPADSATGREIATAKFVTDKITPINTALSQEVTDRTKAISDLKTSLASDYVTLGTQQNISGLKVFTRASNSIILKEPNMDVTTTPTSDVISKLLWQDKNAKNVGWVKATHNTANQHVMELTAVAINSSNKEVYGAINVSVKPDGTTKTNAPNPASNSNDTSIATTAWVNTKISASATSINDDKVTIGGQQTISGLKTFTNSLQAPAIELYTATPFVDFHFNDSTADYTSRIIAEANAYLHCTGTFAADAFKALSDKNYKKDITPVSYDLSKLKSYKYKLKNDKANSWYVGLIAQEVQEIIPEAVTKTKTKDGDYLTLDYNAIVAALVGEVNQLKKRIEVLENK